MHAFLFFFQTNAYFLNRRSYDIMQHEPENFRQKRLAMTLKDAVINTYSTFHTPYKSRFGSNLIANKYSYLILESGNPIFLSKQLL